MFNQQNISLYIKLCFLYCLKDNHLNLPIYSKNNIFKQNIILSNIIRLVYKSKNSKSSDKSTVRIDFFVSTVLNNFLIKVKSSFNFFFLY